MTTNAMTKIPATTTLALEPRISKAVARGFVSCGISFLDPFLNTFGVCSENRLAHRPERARPSRQIKKVNDRMRQKPQPVAHVAHLVLVVRRDE